MMKRKIKIFGLGGAKERQLLAEVRAVARELKIAVELEQICDVEHFIRESLPAIPAVWVDGRMVANGRLPDRAEILSWLAPREPSSA